MKLRTDDSGRLTGQYTFSDADPLDHYHLVIRAQAEGPPIDGSARVMLGEYRKTKVGVKLKGEVKDGKLVVTFDARDYLDHSVKGTSATWSATVTKAADLTKLTLDPDAFVVTEGGPPSVDDFDALPDDERLLTLANGVSALSFAGMGGRTIATREGKIDFTGGEPKVTIDLWPEWMQGQHTIALSAMFLDETGRENRAVVGTFSLSPKRREGGRVLVHRRKCTATGGESAGQHRAHQHRREGCCRNHHRRCKTRIQPLVAARLHRRYDHRPRRRFCRITPAFRRLWSKSP